MSKVGTVAPNSDADPIRDAAKPICGVVRPIAGIEGYPEGHWLEVHQIIAEAAADAGYEARLVSDDEAIGVIMGRIVSNLHDYPIVVVDVSALNPNVFFELGMRLTFDKPTVVIKDDATRYPFDASPIEYIPYPSNLRHGLLMTFKAKLSVAIKKTAEANQNPAHRSFLNHFGTVQAGKLGDDQTLSSSLILDEIRSLKGMVRRQSNITSEFSRFESDPTKRPSIRFVVRLTQQALRELISVLRAEFGSDQVILMEQKGKDTVIEVGFNGSLVAGEQVRATVAAYVSSLGGSIV